MDKQLLSIVMDDRYDRVLKELAGLEQKNRTSVQRALRVLEISRDFHAVPNSVTEDEDGYIDLIWVDSRVSPSARASFQFGSNSMRVYTEEFCIGNVARANYKVEVEYTDICAAIKKCWNFVWRGTDGQI